MEYKQRLKLVAVVIIFLILLSWSFSNYIVTERYSKSSAVSEDLKDLKLLVGNNTAAIKKINTIEEKVSFINGFCFEYK
jgi:hypothetical protein